MRYTGEVLLALGFAMLAIAALIRDPTALDANIGAGGLTLVGLPIGTAGLCLTIAGVALGIRRRSTRRHERPPV